MAARNGADGINLHAAQVADRFQNLIRVCSCVWPREPLARNRETASERSREMDGQCYLTPSTSSTISAMPARGRAIGISLPVIA